MVMSSEFVLRSDYFSHANTFRWAKFRWNDGGTLTQDLVNTASEWNENFPYAPKFVLDVHLFQMKPQAECNNKTIFCTTEV